MGLAGGLPKPGICQKRVQGGCLFVTRQGLLHAVEFFVTYPQSIHKEGIIGFATDGFLHLFQGLGIFFEVDEGIGPVKMGHGQVRTNQECVFKGIQGFFEKAGLVVKNALVVPGRIGKGVLVDLFLKKSDAIVH